MQYATVDPRLQSCIYLAFNSERKYFVRFLEARQWYMDDSPSIGDYDMRQIRALTLWPQKADKSLLLLHIPVAATTATTATIVTIMVPKKKKVHERGFFFDFWNGSIFFRNN